MILTTITTTVPAQCELDAEREDGNIPPALCAEYGRAACEVGSPDAGSNDTRTDAVDTIANILHRAAQEGVDLDYVVRMAREHFDAEA